MSEHEKIDVRVSFLHTDDQYCFNLTERTRLLSLINELTRTLITECLETANKYFPNATAHPLLITKDPEILKILQELPSLTHQLKKASSGISSERSFDYVSPVSKEMGILLYCLVQFFLYLLPEQLGRFVSAHSTSDQAFVPDFSMQDDEGLLHIIQELRNCFTYYNTISESTMSDTIATKPLIKIDIARLRAVEKMLTEV